MYILIAAPDALDYKKDLEAGCPEIPIHAVTTEAGIKDHADKMEILITIYRVADELLKPAVNLKWIQVITSGVNYLLSRPSLRKDVIVTSGRGIHGPQDSGLTGQQSSVLLSSSFLPLHSGRAGNSALQPGSFRGSWGFLCLPLLSCNSSWI